MHCMLYCRKSKYNMLTILILHNLIPNTLLVFAKYYKNLFILLSIMVTSINTLPSIYIFFSVSFCIRNILVQTTNGKTTEIIFILNLWISIYYRKKGNNNGRYLLKLNSCWICINSWKIYLDSLEIILFNDNWNHTSVY